MSSNATGTAIEARNIELTLSLANGEPVHILRGVNFTVEQGGKIGLVGPSGSGKTSLLTIIAGLQRPTAGAISVLGIKFDDCSEEDLAAFRRDNIGVVFQNFHLLPAMTALENVAIPLEIAGQTNADARAAEALATVGLEHRHNHFPHQLSGGEQQRTAIARAFVAHPKLILADEPTGNLDTDTGAMVMESLESLAAQYGASLLLITHDHALLEGFDRVLSMRDGQLKPSGQADNAQIR